MTREEEVVARSNAFRAQYRADTPTWYRGEMHLAFTLVFTFGVILYCASRLQQPSWLEWVGVVLPMFLFGNWAEWAAHRYLLHSPKSLLKSAYKRHVNTHHQFFSHKTLDYHGHRDWRALLFPPFAPVLFVLAALPPALLLGSVWTPNTGYIAMLTMAAYFLMYEGLHTLSHIEHPLLDRLPLVNTVRRMHVLHHNPDFMHTRNFNLTFPICDALFGTSDLNKGLLGTLFNGMSDEARNEEDQARVRAQQVRRAGQAQPAGEDAAGAAPHETPGMAIWHFDFYRFDDPQEFEDAGFRDVFAGPGLKLIEWPERAAGLLPPCDLRIDIDMVDAPASDPDADDTRRRATFRAGTPLGATLMP